MKTVSAGNPEAVKRMFGGVPEIAAVYQMPETKDDNSIRLAVVLGPFCDAALVKLPEAVHGLELRINEIADVFCFEYRYCPPCRRGEAFYERVPGFFSDGEGYFPPNEDEGNNLSKVMVIETFADLISRDRKHLERLRVSMSAETVHPETPGERVYIDDWGAYLRDYPVELLVRFLKSRTNHIREISPSSPILRYAPDWMPYA